MHVSIRIIAVAAVVALLVPVAAVAKDATIEGPAAIAGAGFFGGEIEMAATEGQRPFRIVGRVGYVGFLDLAGDLKVRCAGKGRVTKKQTEAGVVHLCSGRGGQAVALGSHFKLRGHALRYRAFFPAGASATFHGRFVECTKREDGWECERPERPTKAEPKQRGERPAKDAEDEIPSLDELAAMLDGK
jgi:hypothetical protein